MNVEAVVTELLKAGAADPFTKLVMAVLKTRLRLAVEIDRRPFDDRPSAFQCKVNLVMLSTPSEYDDVDVTDADTVICSTTTDFSIPSV